MSLLTTDARKREETWKRHLFPLSAGGKVGKGWIACIDKADGTVKPGSASTTLIRIGLFAEAKDNTTGGTAVPVNVDLDNEIVITFLDNDVGGTPLAASDVGNDAYVLDNHTVTKTSAGHSSAGRVWIVDAVKGVGVQAYWL